MFASAGRRTRGLAMVAALAASIAWQDASAAPISPGCLPSGLPAEPIGSVATFDTTTNFGESLHVEVWRQGCADGSGTVVLLRATPTSAAPLFCSADFTLAQGGLQHNALLMPSTAGGRMCGDLNGPATVVVDAAAGPAIAFDREQAFTLIFEGWDASGPKVFQVSLPAAADSPVTLAAAVLPGSRSVQVGHVASAFASVIAVGPVPAVGCTVTPASAVPATFEFRKTNAANQPVGGPNESATIPGGGTQTFVLAFTPTAAFPATSVQLNFDCLNTPSAPIVQGLDTLLLSADTNPVSDIVALAATPTSDGIVNVPGANGTGAFALATVNVGAAGLITVSAHTGESALPVSLSLCRTDPVSGACISDLGPSVTETIGSGETPTFAVFVRGNDVVPFDPATSRIFVRFEDAGDAVRGMTSVAVRTQ